MMAAESGRKEHILCVDDEEGILTALRQQLGARFGNEVEIEVDPDAAMHVNGGVRHAMPGFTSLHALTPHY